MRSQVSDWCFSFPRIRGDVPFANAPHSRSARFSPHTRGCSRQNFVLPGPPVVFPAYAGMFLCGKNTRPLVRGFPRIRGDVPTPTAPVMGGDLFSPHTRGCSYQELRSVSRDGVFPAYAGMFRAKPIVSPTPRSFPRIRGDVPSVKSSRAPCRPFPRIRGDVPLHTFTASTLVGFSPHTRGCSQDRF